MGSALNDPVSLGKLPREHREAIIRLLESSTFAAAPRLRSVLVHLMQALEEGFSESVTEQSIGQAVFGRPAGYNASEDNIVRVTIRHLRNRLEEYYSSEGATEPLALVIPKGKYIPLFVSRERALSPPTTGVATDSAAPEAVLTAASAMKIPVPSAEDFSNKKPSFRWMWLGFAAAILVSFFAGYTLRVFPLQSTQQAGMLGQLFRPGEDISLVPVDSNLQAYRQIFERQVSLDDYIRRAYAKEALDTSDPRVINAQRFSTGTNETNVSSVIIGADVKRAFIGRHLSIKHPHDVSVRDFQNQGNVILLGGPWINPWGQLFENRFNFRLLPRVGDPSSSEIHNQHPIGDEAMKYLPHMDGNLNVNYARIAIVPNLDNTGHVVLLGATSPESLEAAGTYLLSEQSIQQLLNKFHVNSVNALPPLEFLLEVRGLDDVPASYRILAIRTVR